MYPNLLISDNERTTDHPITPTLSHQPPRSPQSTSAMLNNGPLYWGGVQGSTMPDAMPASPWELRVRLIYITFIQMIVGDLTE